MPVFVFMAAAQPDLSGQIAFVKKIAAFLDIPLDIVDLAEDFEHKEAGAELKNLRTVTPSA